MRGGLNLTLLVATTLGAGVIAAALTPARAYGNFYDQSGTVIANNVILLL